MSEWERRVNIPLLRKAVEWVEAQEALPRETRQWIQSTWVISEHERVEGLEHPPGCGTAYCLAGWVAAQKYPELADASSAEIDGRFVRSEDVAVEELGLPRFGDEPLSIRFAGVKHPLFSPDNTAAVIRRIAERLAGEPL